MTPLVRALRWLAVLPGALLSVVLAQFPLHWMIMIWQSGSGEESIITRDGKPLIASLDTATLERMGTAFVTPLVFVYVGARIAPRVKAQTGIALALLWAAGFGAASLFAILRGDYVGGGWFYFVASCVLGIIGVTVGLVQARKLSTNSLALPDRRHTEKVDPRILIGRLEKAGLIAWKDGDRETALRCYDKVIELDPDNAVTLLNRGNLQLELGRYEEGITDLEKASKLNPALPTQNAALFKALDSDMREMVRQRLLER
jgi:tetratricopeptide (TPR) repeat protein